MVIDVITGVLLLFIVAFATNWLKDFLKKGKKRPAARPRFGRYDYVVVGAGPGGCSCAAVLIEELLKHSTKNSAPGILLVEKGTASEGSKLEALSLAHWSLRTGIDIGKRHYVQQQTEGSTRTDEEKEEEKKEEGHDANSTKAGSNHSVWVPRGSGVGGTSLLDWGLHMTPPKAAAVLQKLSGKREETTAPKPPLSLSTNRNPLSWAFAEVAGTEGFSKLMLEEGDALEAEEQQKQSGVVAPLWLRTTLKAHKVNYLSSYIDQKRRSNESTGSNVFELAVGWECVDGQVGDDGKVQFITLQDTVGKTVKIQVAKALFVATGTIATPKLVSSLYPRLRSDIQPSYDVPCVPLIYQARPGLTNDSKNIHGVMSYLRWMLSKPSTLSNCVCDTIASIPAKNGGTISILFLPSGGFNRELYAKLGRSFSLGVFAEAVTFLVCYSRSGGKTMALYEDPTEAKKPLASEIVDGLREGITLCRSLAGKPPLAHLLMGKEALDVSLFPEQMPRQQIFRVLYGKPPKKTTAMMEKAAGKLRATANEAAFTDDYLNRYVARHLTTLGWPCGSMHGVDFPAGSNVHIADASAINPATLEYVGGGGAVALTQAMGAKAATLALEPCNS